MSQTAIDVAVLPALIALTLLLECTRIGCTWLFRQAHVATADLRRASRPAISR